MIVTRKVISQLQAEFSCARLSIVLETWRPIFNSVHGDLSRDGDDAARLGAASESDEQEVKVQF